MKSIELMQKTAQILDSKKASEITAIKVRDLTVVTDYFIIASANNTTLVKTLADEVDEKLKEQGITPNRVEGYQGANWIILDYSDVVVHIFYQETRDFYSLEKLWADGEIVDLSEILD